MICRRMITLGETLGLKAQVNAEDFSAVHHPVSSGAERLWLSLCKLLQPRHCSSTEAREVFCDIEKSYINAFCDIHTLWRNFLLTLVFYSSMCSLCS